MIKQISKIDLDKRLQELCEKNWKVKNILKVKPFDEQPERLQNLILKEIGLQKRQIYETIND